MKADRVAKDDGRSLRRAGGLLLLLQQRRALLPLSFRELW